MPIEPGLQATLAREVTDADTAAALGSGDLEVLATPRLLAWCEAATVSAVRGGLAADQTSVGTRIELQHLRGTATGGRVEVRAELVHVDGRLLRFQVMAEDGDGAVVAQGEITRVVVDREHFLSRL